jgi:hypothetical protein
MILQNRVDRAALSIPLFISCYYFFTQYLLPAAHTFLRCAPTYFFQIPKKTNIFSSPQRPIAYQMGIGGSFTGDTVDHLHLLPPVPHTSWGGAELSQSQLHEYLTYLSSFSAHILCISPYLFFTLYPFLLLICFSSLFLPPFRPSLSPSLYVYHNLFGFTLPENRLRSGRSGIRIPVGETFLSSPKRTDRLWGPPSDVFNGYQGSFPDVKRPECDVDHSPPSSVDVKKCCAIRLLLLYTFMTWKGANLPLNFLLWFHKCLTLIYYQELEDMPYN